MLLIILGVVLLIGLSSVDRALMATLKSSATHFEIILSITSLVVIYVGWNVLTEKELKP